MKTSPFSYLKNDLMSGLVVFLIAVPLCLGIALASGAPLIAGINAGIVGGIVVGLLSKSQLSVTGPAAGLTAIVLVAIPALGGFQLFLCAVIVAGIFQFILGLLKAGSISNYFPSNVIEGMLAGIGVIIILRQLPHAFGYDIDNDGEFFSVETGGENMFDLALNHINFLHPGAIVAAIVSILILILWQRPAFKKIQWLPGGLIAVISGVVINEIFKASGSSWEIGRANLVTLPTPSSVSEYFGQYVLPDVSGFSNPKVWTTGLVIAVVASIESLLCIEATDKLDPMKRFTSGSKELLAQGVGNIVSGLIGGLPVTSVIVRSSANINAGGRTKLATIFHGVLLLVLVALIPMVLNLIPYASLAGILIITGYKLCHPRIFKQIWKEGGWVQFLPFVVTVVAVVSIDLLKGVGIGLAVSIFFILRQNMRNSYYFQRSSYKEGELIKIQLSEEVSFLNKGSIKKTLDNLPEGSNVIIDAGNTQYIDFDVLHVIQDFAVAQAAEKDIKVSLVGFRNIYKLPTVDSERDIISRLIDKKDEPKRSSGRALKLLNELMKK
ncbi:MAG TPA: SulP family inorganic anion transporter [Chitinophagaceae bacterium]|nr:SulP family inorganic anion transporter [Chitinophagaceae bacterium]